MYFKVIINHSYVDDYGQCSGQYIISGYWLYADFYFFFVKPTNNNITLILILAITNLIEIEGKRFVKTRIEN
jgi:hypothetical protein